MKEKWRHIFSDVSCPSVEDLEKYSKGKLPPAQKFALENHLSGCNMCNDVLEGLLQLENSKSLANAEKDISERLNLLLFGKQRGKVMLVVRKVAIAASVLLIMGIAFWIFYKPPVKPPFITQNLPATKHAADTAEQVISDKRNKEHSVLAQNKDIAKPRSAIPFAGQSEAVSSELRTSNEPEKPTENLVTEELPVVQYPETVTSVSKKRDMAVITDRNEKGNLSRATVSGYVIDRQTGEPLIGVSIVIKGTSTGTITDQNGKFTLEVPESSAILSFSYIGYITKEQESGKEKEMAIAMDVDAKTLDEVVVVGYGTQMKRELSGAVSGVASKSKTKTKTPSGQADIDSLRKKVRENPQDKTSLKDLAKQCIEMRYKDEAIKTLQELISFSDPATNSQLEEIIKLLQDLNYDKALRKLKRIEIQ